MIAALSSMGISILGRPGRLREGGVEPTPILSKDLLDSTDGDDVLENRCDLLATESLAPGFDDPSDLESGSFLDPCLSLFSALRQYRPSLVVMTTRYM
jgi:hypothetical protein